MLHDLFSNDEIMILDLLFVRRGGGKARKFLADNFKSTFLDQVMPASSCVQCSCEAVVHEYQIGMANQLSSAVIESFIMHERCSGDGP